MQEKQSLVVPAALCTLATMLAVLLLSGAAILLNKAGSFGAFTSSHTLLSFSAVLLCGVGAVVVMYFIGFRQRNASHRRALRLTIVGSLIAVMLLLSVAELMLRSRAVPTALGMRVGELEMLPHDWEQARQTGRLWLERARSAQAIFGVEDAYFGWDLGRGRRSADGMYATSVEGVRSSNAASRLAAEQPRHRVALIGDSFTFGEEVFFDQTWGQHLERTLPDGTQVLNFGVPSHGIDQTLLKYGRDVRPWGAQVTILSFLNASPLRHTTMYLLLRPDQQLPFTKPRFVLQGEALNVLNVPPLPAEALLARASIWDLPGLEHDSQFIATRWTPALAHGPYVARWLFSRFPKWPAAGAQPSKEAVVALASRLIQQLAAEIRAAGSQPLIVALPVREDLTSGSTPYHDAVIQELARKGIEVVNISACLLQHVSIDQAFVPRDRSAATHEAPGPPHYSSRGNAVVAACLQPIVAEMLRHISAAPRTRN